MRTAPRLVAASLVLLAACSKRLDVDQAQLAMRLDRSAEEAMETAEVRRALDELWASVAADPRVARSGGALLPALGSDPRLGPGFERIIDDLGKQPAMLQMVRQVMRENPRATPEQIGTAMEQRVAGITEGPVFDRAFDKAFDRLMQRPEIATIINGFGEKVGKSPQLAQMMTSTLGSRVVEARWRDRIVALNGGAMPDRERATDLVARELFAKERLSGWYAKLFRLPALRREVASAVARLLDAPAFRRLTADLCATLVGDATFQARAVAGMGVLLGAEPSEEAMEQAIARLLDAKVVSTALTTWLKALMADPEIAAIGDQTLQAIAAAPELQKSVAELVEVK